MRLTRLHLLSIMAAVTVTAAFLMVPSARAQDALGAGNALDSNLRVGSGGVNDANQSNQPIDYRLRNLTVTGDVPGGRGFRGAVGYRAEGDFAGQLGSDDLFQFRAQSAFSAPSYIQYGTTAEQLRFGQALGDLTYRRSGAPTVQQQQAGRDPSVQQRDRMSDRVRLDWAIQSVGISDQLRGSAEPRPVGVAISPEGEETLYSVSPLRGLARLTPEEAEQMYGDLGLYDRLRLQEDEVQGRKTSEPGAPFKVEFDSLGGIVQQDAPGEAGGEDESPEPGDALEPGATRIDALGNEDYRRVLKSVARRYAGSRNITWNLEDAMLDDLGKEYEDLRAQLRGAGDRADAEDGSRRDDPMEDLLKPRGEDDDEDDEDGEGEEDERPRFEIFLRHGERITQLAGEDDGRFNELLGSAEQKLREGEYFWAERRFMRALRFVPGHPTATAGLAHSQLGAGLYGSSALTLRSLFTHQPEMIDVRYADELLPNRPRLLAAIGELRNRVKQNEDPGLNAFLMAYIGHQLEERPLVEEGLGIIEGAEPDHPLLEVLRSVWLAEEEPEKP